jgi:hypothetical protein
VPEQLAAPAHGGCPTGQDPAGFVGDLVVGDLVAGTGDLVAGTGDLLGDLLGLVDGDSVGILAQHVSRQC